MISLCRLTLYTVNGDSVFSLASPLFRQELKGSNPSVEGFNYKLTIQFPTPQLVSGLYLIENKIPVIIKSTTPVDVMIVYPSNTANAYSYSGGKSLYSKVDRPWQVSFQRPIVLQPFSEFCMKWFQTLQDVKVGYIADVDMEDYAWIEGSKILTIVGHSEYWTRQGRLNFDRFVENGGNALVLSGNTMWWQVRYTPDRKGLICYKDYPDPISDPLLKTTHFVDYSLKYPIIKSIGADFDLGGYGVQEDKGWNGYKVVRPDSPLLEGLGLQKGDIISLPTVEYDGAPLTGFDKDGYPIINTKLLGFEKIEMIGFDKGFRFQETAGTFIAFRRKSSSGIVINMASTDWCSSSGMGSASGDMIKKITRNAITKLLNHQPVFSH
jgi:hypothetical protein